MKEIIGRVIDSLCQGSQQKSENILNTVNLISQVLKKKIIQKTERR